MKTRAFLLTLLLVVPLAPAHASSASAPFVWGSDLSQWWTYDDATRGPALSIAEATGMRMIFADAKDGHGYANWATTAYPTITPFGARDGGLERIVRDAHAKGIEVAVRFDAFEDSNAAAKIPGARIGGNPAWVDPACPEVRAHLVAMLRDMLAKVAVDEVNLDHVRYPVVGEAPGTSPLPCAGGTLAKSSADRTKIIADFVAEASAAIRAARPGVRVSASVFPETMVAPHAGIGQDASRLAGHVDVLMPMIYPGYWWAGSSKSAYDIVRENAAAGVAKHGSAKIRPWVQGDGEYAANPAKICEEIRGAKDAGASGAFVWWFPSVGLVESTWQGIRDCAGLASTPPPPPPPAAFEPAFSPKAGNSWWVEVNVRSDRPLASVTANVGDDPPVALSLRKWGSYAKSFYVPAGSIVTFTAKAADGSTATSGGYVWPKATPAGASFVATFEKGGANEWWVETWVTANADVAGVTASVDGGRAIPLSATTWGSYAKSFYVEPGSTIRFTATAADGRQATSAAFAWP